VLRHTLRSQEGKHTTGWEASLSDHCRSTSRDFSSVQRGDACSLILIRLVGARRANAVTWYSARARDPCQDPLDELCTKYWAFRGPGRFEMHLPLTSGTCANLSALVSNPSAARSNVSVTASRDQLGPLTAGGRVVVGVRACHAGISIGCG
jgi:hypothetical protein